MAEVINHTEVFCHTCASPHPARQVRDNGKIIGIVDCPVAPWQTTLSEHADLFLQFRRQAGFDPNFHPPDDHPFFFHHVSITDDCNCRCPVCYSDSGTKARNDYLSLDEAQVMARTAVKNGARTIIMVGGEPTLHPHLPELIQLFRRAKLRVWLASNGLRIAQKPELVLQLKNVGLEKVSLQFDSFEPTTHRAIRGHDDIPAKLVAARIIIDAGLALGLICTVTSHNLAELSSICRHLFAWPKPPGSVIFQGAAHAGRLAIDSECHINREMIITALVEGEAIPGLTVAHFWPIPTFRPLHVHVHPDCAANTIAVIGSRGVEPASAYVNMEKFLVLASQSPACRHPGTRQRYLVMLALKCMRPKGWRLMLEHAWERLRGKTGIHIVFISTGAFLRRDFHDLSRIERCGSGGLTANGCESLCAFHGKQPCNGT